MTDANETNSGAIDNVSSDSIASSLGEVDNDDTIKQVEKYDVDDDAAEPISKRDDTSSSYLPPTTLQRTNPISRRATKPGAVPVTPNNASTASEEPENDVLNNSFSYEVDDNDNNLPTNEDITRNNFLNYRIEDTDGDQQNPDMNEITRQGGSPLEATLVRQDSIQPVLVKAELMSDQNNKTFTCFHSSYTKRLCILLAVVIVAVTVCALLIVFLRDKKGQDPDLSITYHAIIIGGRTSCSEYRPGTVTLYCSGLNVVDTDMARIKLHYKSPDTTRCESRGSNTLECTVEPEIVFNRVRQVHSNIIFSCERQRYIDTNEIAAAAILNESVATNCFVDRNVTNNKVPRLISYVGLGHFCQKAQSRNLVSVKNEQQKTFVATDSFVLRRKTQTLFNLTEKLDLVWSLEPNIVVRDDVLFDQKCETENATFIPANPLSSLNYCVSYDSNCLDTDDESSNCILTADTLKATDSFSKCQINNADMTVKRLADISLQLDISLTESKMIPNQFND